MRCAIVPLQQASEDAKVSLDRIAELVKGLEQGEETNLAGARRLFQDSSNSNPGFVPFNSIRGRTREIEGI